MNFTIPRSLQRIFPTGEELQLHLSHISQGVSLPKNDTCDTTSLVRLPQFAFVQFNERRHLNLIQWSSEKSIVTLYEGMQHVLYWKIEDTVLETLSGALYIEPILTGHIIDGQIPGVPKPALPKVERKNHHRIEQDAHNSMFFLLNTLREYTKTITTTIARRIYSEVYELDPLESTKKTIIDDIEIEIITDSVLFGTSGTTSRAMSALTRLASTNATLFRSPMKYLATSLWNAAHTEIRTMLGDARHGRLIRKTSKLLETTNPPLLCQQLKLTHPHCHIGTSSIHKALTVEASNAATAISYESLHDAATKP